MEVEEHMEVGLVMEEDMPLLVIVEEDITPILVTVGLMEDNLVQVHMVATFVDRSKPQVAGETPSYNSY